MIYKVFSVYDSKARSYSRPFYAINEEIAVRMFASAIDDPESQLGKHPADFSLHLLGSFDDSTGTFHDQIEKLNLGLAATLKEVH